MRRILAIWIAIGAVSALASGCSGAGGDLNSCTTDEQCAAPGTRCDVEVQRCVCESDDACADGEFCNRAGVCQTRAGCNRNSDCVSVADTYCDLSSGQCLAGPPETGQCSIAGQCPLDSICTDGVCVPGCFTDGDCTLGGVCAQGQCTRTPGVCTSDAFCAFGERCVGNLCRKDRRGPYCRGCTQPTGVNPTPCDDPKNLCLVNNFENGGFQQICGVDCSLGQPCPNGYQCGFVVVLTRQSCRSSAACQCDGNLGASCRVDADCPGGQACTAGLCCDRVGDRSRQCRLGENQTSGFCTCSTDEDCPRETCDPSRRVCTITGNPCTPGGGECSTVACVEGGCRIGQNCAPITGLNCSTLLGD